MVDFKLSTKEAIELYQILTRRFLNPDLCDKLWSFFSDEDAQQADPMRFKEEIK